MSSTSADRVPQDGCGVDPCPVLRQRVDSLVAEVARQLGEPFAAGWEERRDDDPFVAMRSVQAAVATATPAGHGA